jgi:tRNA(adenine34) deaminase
MSNLPSWVFGDADHAFMGEAIAEALRAGSRGEVPVGAVLVSGGEIIARSGNRREELHDPTAHAEILVLRAGGAARGNRRLDTETLYVTLEPCPMCLEACRQARVSLVIWGASDPVMGACGSVLDAAEDPRLKPPVAQRGGLEAAASSKILKEFFAKKRLSS